MLKPSPAKRAKVSRESRRDESYSVLMGQRKLFEGLCVYTITNPTQKGKMAKIPSRRGLKIVEAVTHCLMIEDSLGSER